VSATRQAGGFHNILEESGRLSLDRFGTVSVDGLEIKGSNINDLLHDLFNKLFVRPQGINEFIALIAELGVPLTFIDNPAHYQTVGQLREQMYNDGKREGPPGRRVNKRKQEQALAVSSLSKAAKLENAGWVAWK
jgi:hypothetical protein